MFLQELSKYLRLKLFTIWGYLVFKPSHISAHSDIWVDGADGNEDFQGQSGSDTTECQDQDDPASAAYFDFVGRAWADGRGRS